MPSLPDPLLSSFRFSVLRILALSARNSGFYSMLEWKARVRETDAGRLKPAFFTLAILLAMRFFLSSG